MRQRFTRVLALRGTAVPHRARLFWLAPFPARASRPACVAGRLGKWRNCARRASSRSRDRSSCGSTRGALAFVTEHAVLGRVLTHAAQVGVDTACSITPPVSPATRMRGRSAARQGHARHARSACTRAITSSPVRSGPSMVPKYTRECGRYGRIGWTLRGSGPSVGGSGHGGPGIQWQVRESLPSMLGKLLFRYR